MAHALCAIEVPDTFGQNQHKPFAINVRHFTCRRTIVSSQTGRVSLLDRRLRGKEAVVNYDLDVVKVEDLIKGVKNASYK